MDNDEKLAAETSRPEEIDASTDSDSDEIKSPESNVEDTTLSNTKPSKMRFSEKHPTATKILQGLGVATVAAGLLALVKYLSRDEPIDYPAPIQLCDDVQSSPADVAIENTPLNPVSNGDTYVSKEDVTPYRRNLPKGQHASEAKVKQAEAEGNPLKPGQTSVVGYPRERTIHKK